MKLLLCVLFRLQCARLVDLRIFKAWTMMCGLHAPGGGWHPVVELLDEVLCDLDWEADMCITDRLRFTERGFADVKEPGKVIGPRHYPSLSQSLRNTRGRELLRIVDTAAPNLEKLCGTQPGEVFLCWEWNEQEFLIVLKALALDGQFRRALRLLREMKEIGIELDIIKYNWVLAAMAKDKQVQRALAMLEEMRQKEIIPDLQSSLNGMEMNEPRACKPKEWEEAVHILRTLMPKADIEPDAQSFEHVAAACEEGLEWQKSLDLFMEIEQRGLSASSVGHNYALSACRQGKRWKHGFEIMEIMKEKGFEPDFRLKMDLEAQSRGLEKAPPPEPSSRSMPSPDNVWQRKQQLRELREQDKRRQEERRLEEERQKRLREAHGEPVRSAEKKEEKEEKQEKKVEKEKVQNVTKAPSTEAEPPKPAETAPPEEREARTSAPEPREPREPREPQRQRPKRDPRKPKLRAPGSYVLPVFAQHDRSNHAERQALIKVIARVQEASGAQTDAEFEAECAEVTGTVRLYASHTPCISCMACFCQFQRLFPKVKLCVDFDDWRDTRRMVEMARREEEHKKRGTSPPNYDCPGLSDMSDEEEPVELDDMILKPASA
ncbi:unnamed protein product [Durusdinium trenchii]|uniref:Pentatricopeptide repeat-containing protein n=1 Tax=Durusdinium trenchii TaxID=1381693 RepID=A0ABP0QYD7_9DINO